MKVVNKTKSTDFCGLRVGQQREELSVAAGASADFELGTGAYKLCVLACKSAVPARGGNSTNVVGCGDFNLSKPQEIYVFEGKEEPKVEPAAGYQQTKWLNNIDPTYAENAHHPWLTVFGDLKPSYWHVHLDNPCPKAVYVGGKDVKGLGQTRISVDPKRDNDFFGDKPPVYFYFSRDIRGADKPTFDLPAGSYELKVKEDCSEVEVKEAKYPRAPARSGRSSRAACSCGGASAAAPPATISASATRPLPPFAATRRWHNTPRRAAAKRVRTAGRPSVSHSPTRRLTAVAGLAATTPDSTSRPVSAAPSASSPDSRSPMSLTSNTSTSWRPAARRPAAMVGTSSPTSRCTTTLRRSLSMISTGSSMVTTRSGCRVVRSSISAASVVVLPPPGPDATSTRPGAGA